MDQQTAEIVALAQVILLDIVLSGDNAVIIGMVAASLSGKQRKLAIMFGMVLAVILRIGLTFTAASLLHIWWLALAGGVSLLWVGGKMYRDLRAKEAGDEAVAKTAKTLAHAIALITVADVSMSLDNVLAVAAASKDHPLVMTFGLVLSISLMAVAATYVAKLLDKWTWLAWIGLGLVWLIAGRLIYEAMGWT